MRKVGVIMSMVVLVMTIGTVLGCGGGEPSQSPTEVADEYMQATVDLDVDTVYDLLSKADQQSITKEQMKELAGAQFEAVEMSYVIGQETINGDKATVEVTVTVTDKASGESQEVTDQLTLVKEDGAWKVSFTGSP